jgi:hypothetical protein
MPEQDPSPVDLIEWGNPPAGPHMVPPPVPAPVPVVGPMPAVEPPARRAGPVALALLAIGFGLAISAQYMPWSSIKTGAADAQETDSLVTTVRRLPTSIDIDLANMNTGHVVTYLTTMVLALVAIAVLLSSTGAVRRIATAAAAGLLAGNVLVLVGFKSAIDNLGASPFTAYSLPEQAIGVGAGYPLAYAAALVLAAGVFMAVRGPLLTGRPGRRSRRPVEQPESGEPLDLTVSAVPPSKAQ